MKKYKKIVKKILQKGKQKADRTGTGTISIFSHKSTYNMALGFPLVTTKKVNFDSIVHELLWFISGNTNTKYLTDRGVNIWNSWADADGNLGKIYGYQWRKSGGIDQLKNVIEKIKSNPNDRGLIVNSWNTKEIHEMKLRPCHTMFQFYVNDGILDLQLYQRSADVFLGVPYNIASYSLLLLMVAQVTGLKAGRFIHVLGDAHIYNNHIPQMNKQIKRKAYQLPEVQLNPDIMDIDKFKFEDISLLFYDFHPVIKGKVAV